MTSESAKPKPRKRLTTPDVESMTAGEIAIICGVAYDKIALWKGRGCPVNDDKTMNAPAVVAWLQTRAREDSKKKAARTAGGDSLDRYRDEKRRIAKLERQQMEGGLVPVELAEQILVEEITAAKAALLGLPRKLAPRMAGLEPRQVEQELREEIETALRRLENRRASLAAKSKKKEAADERPAPSRKRRAAKKSPRRVARP